jgi:hypothetical protein
MAKRPNKSQMVAFKVEQELAEFLDKLPNKSEFIRRAIVAQFAMSCPLCKGSGTVPQGIHKHYAPIIAEHYDRTCEICGDTFPFPADLNGLEGNELKRIEQFFHGGPFYCAQCYETAPPCDDCGWHLHPRQLADHLRRTHMDMH